MKTFRTVAAGISVALLSAISIASAAPPDIAQSKQVATAWLAKLDADDFTTCWNLLSTDLRNRVARWKWNLQGRMGRFAMGKATARKLNSVERDTKSPSGRPGEFVILKFQTQSEKRGPVIEVVAVEEDHDGQLRVGGYAVGTEKSDKP
jgi:hypothetical protein